MQESTAEWAAKQMPITKDTNDTFWNFLLIVLGIISVFMVIVWWMITSEDDDEEEDPEEEDDVQEK